MLFKVYNRYYSCSSDARVRRNLWYLLTLELCLFISFTVLWMSCGVMFISSIGMESLLGGGVGLELVVGVADSVLAVVCGARGTISKENLASRVCNLLDTRSLTLKKFIFLIIEDFNHWFEPIYVGAYPIDSPHNIYYYWAQDKPPYQYQYRRNT